MIIHAQYNFLYILYKYPLMIEDRAQLRIERAETDIFEMTDDIYITGLLTLILDIKTYMQFQ